MRALPEIKPLDKDDHSCELGKEIEFNSVVRSVNFDCFMTFLEPFQNVNKFIFVCTG